MKIANRAVLLSIIAMSMMLITAPPRSASAHPMGNFTINHYSALTIGEDRVDIHFVLDMAEIPAYQELGAIRADHNTNLTPAESDAYTSRKGAEILKGMALSVDGKPVDLTIIGKPTLSFPPGAGGLPTLRLEINLVAPLQGIRKGTLEYQENNYSERIGWKEIIARAASGVSLTASTAPTTDLSDALHKYPVDLLTNPPRLISASLQFEVGGAPAASSQLAQPQVAPTGSGGFGSLEWVRQQTDAITSILKEKDLPLGALLVALAIAFSVGAAHALSPGHGKTVVAAYLVGSRGTPLHAIMLGLTVTISHTIGVFVLGFVVLYLANFILPETLYPWLSFFSGALLVVMGLTLFVQRWKLWKRGNSPFARSAGEHSHSHDEYSHSHDSHDSHDHAHGDHDHEHDQAHNHPHEHSHDDPTAPHKHGPLGRAHTHVPTDGQKVTLWNLLALGITGGIIPCPSALVVLLVAIASGQVALGLLLILAFSTGLAVVLMVIGLLMVYSRNLLNRFTLKSNKLAGALGRLPMLSALAVSFLGVLIAAGAFNIK